jgi:hypothetical protein
VRLADLIDPAQDGFVAGMVGVHTEPKDIAEVTARPPTDMITSPRSTLAAKAGEPAVTSTTPARYGQGPRAIGMPYDTARTPRKAVTPMWIRAEALPAAIAAATDAAWLAGIANAWVVPELIWNCAEAAVFSRSPARPD